MNGKPSNFYLPEGYRCNPPVTLDYETADAYWTTERIALSESYQHHVYLLAVKIAARNRCQTALDVGCGPATKTRALLNAGVTEIVLVDQPSSEKMVRTAIPDAAFIALDLEAAKPIAASHVPGGKFDLIICADVIEHLFDPTPCLKLVLYHLKPTGVAIFSTPNRDILRGKHSMSSPNPAHVREWTNCELRNLLVSMGFVIHQHSNLPPKKLGPVEDVIRKTFHRFICIPRWHACQVAVCGKK